MNFLPGLLLLSHILLVKGDQYDYYDYYDYYDHDYCEYMTTYESDDYLCEDDFCMDKTQRVSVEFETEAPIRDTNLMEIDTYYEYFNVLRESGIRECSPSLEIKVIKYIYQINLIKFFIGFEKKNKTKFLDSVC